MTEDELNKRLNSGRISMPERDALVKAVIANPKLLGHLLQLVFEEDKTEFWHCSWVFDNVMRKKPVLLLPHLDDFCSGLAALKSESVIRPMAHVCELLVLARFKKKEPEFLHKLLTNHLELIAESCFDWLIGQHKVASKVFSMTCLLYLGEKFDWIRPELKSVIEQQISTGSAGFKSRGMKTLNQLKKLGY